MAAIAAAPAPTPAQPTGESPRPASGAVADSLARLRVRVRHDTSAVAGATVRADGTTARTTDAGEAILPLPAGAHTLVTSRLGFRPDTVRLTLRSGQDTIVVVQLERQEAELAAVVVSATRGERPVEDTPLRVEVIDEEEIGEKVAMTPGDIAMMLNESSGLRVQVTNPSLGGANVRVQGLRGRYGLILADGLPLHGGQAGGLGLLQIPPLDLGRVEVIKGAASALHGSTALGGVINLVSRRPGETRAGTALVNRTSRGGTDGVLFLSGPVRERLGYTLLAGAHHQTRNDLDDDGWTDMAGYRRAVVRPRLFYADGRGSEAFLTAGLTAEDRDGGTLPGRATPAGGAFPEALRTRRTDLGGLARWIVPEGDGTGRRSPLGGAIVAVRGSVMEQRHAHRIGAEREGDRHESWFGEATVTVPRDRLTWVAGAAISREGYRNADVDGVDYRFTVPAAFLQADVAPTDWLRASGSARVDAHSAYGTVVNPRLSVLLRPAARDEGAGWTVRLSGGTGMFAPTPFTEETEATGLAPVAPVRDLVAERARSGSIDLALPWRTRAGQLDVNLTLFGSRVAAPVLRYEAPGATPTGAPRIRLANAPEPTRTWGGELLARLVHELGEAPAGEEPATLRVTASWTLLRATECDPFRGDHAAPGRSGCPRREVPLTPRHAAGLVASVEQEERGRIGLEVYYTGRQALEDNPYRTTSRPYVVLGLLVERIIDTPAGRARVFVNLENLGNVRQTLIDPLVRPARGPGGRWTTDVWSLLEGRTVNAGVRFGF